MHQVRLKSPGLRVIQWFCKSRSRAAVQRGTYVRVLARHELLTRGATAIDAPRFTNVLRFQSPTRSAADSSAMRSRACRRHIDIVLQHTPSVRVVRSAYVLRGARRAGSVVHDRCVPTLRAAIRRYASVLVYATPARRENAGKAAEVTLERLRADVRR